MNAASSTRPPLVRFAGFAIGLAILVFLVLQVEWDQVWKAMSQGDSVVLLTTLILHAFSLIFLQGMRFKELILDQEMRKRAFLITFAALFTKQFLPTAIGGDAVRVWMLGKSSAYSWRNALGVAALYRLLGLLPIFFFAVLYTLFSDTLTRLAFRMDSPNWPILVLFAVFGFLFFFLLYKRAWIAKVADSIRALGSKRLSRALIWAALFHLARAIAIAGYLLALGANQPAFPDILFVLSLLVVVGLLPLSIGGAGIVEGTLVIALIAYGVPQAEAVAVALFNRCALLLSAASSGMGLFVFERKVCRQLLKGVHIDK